MHRISYSYILILFMFYSGNCSPRMEPLNSQDKRIIEKIEEENHKIHLFLIQTDSGMPETKGILNSVIALESSTTNYPSRTAKLLKEKLQLIQRLDKESDYKNYSEFSLTLFPLVRTAEIENVYKFFCPMTKKFWLARTKLVQNPYSPEMRSCGELIVE